MDFSYLTFVVATALALAGKHIPTIIRTTEGPDYSLIISWGNKSGLLGDVLISI